MRGGAVLLGRQLVSIVIGFGSLIALTRLIGPASYGVYATAYGVYLFAYGLAAFGVETFLIKATAEPTKRQLDAAFTLVMVNAFVVCSVGSLAIHLAAQWANLDRLGAVGTVLLLSLPLHLSIVAPLSRLQRALAFKTVAALELGNQVICQAASIGLAVVGFGVWAPVAGWWASVVWIFVGFFRADRGWRPGVVWDRRLFREMLLFGAGFSVSQWAWQARTFVGPLLAGRFLGPQSVGFVAVVIRLVEALTFIRIPLGRLSIAYLPKVLGDRDGVTRTVQRGVEAAMLILVPISLLFSAVGDRVVPLLFGDSWSGVVTLFPYVSAAYVAACAFSFVTSLLFVTHRERTVVTFQLLHLATFTLGLVLLLPVEGTRGYGYAELLALPMYLILVWGSAPLLERSAVLSTGRWVVASLAAVVAPATSLALLVPLLMLLVLPGTWRGASANIRFVKEAVARRRPDPELG